MSATPESPIPVSVLREALRRYEAASSERAAAAAVEMSQRGLRKFLMGDAKPQAATIKKVTRWYLTQSAGAHLDRETADAALNLIVSSFPEGERARLRANVLGVLREAHKAAGREPPDWLK